MSTKFRSPGKWKSGGDGITRVGTGFSIKKESISGPIPRVEDDEFPIRTPGASIATPIGRESLDRQSRFPGLSVDPRRSGNDVTLIADQARPTKTPSTNSKHTSEEPAPQPEQPAPLRTSMGSVRSRTSIQKPQRKKSTLSKVFGKLFGRKRKSSTSPSRQRDSQDLRSEQHRSDPTALNRSPPPATNAQKRSASLPINEFNRALRSHSVIMEDFPLRDSYEPRDSKAEGSITRPRGATTPSRLWEHHRPGYMDWTGLSPRPASSHARGSKVDSNEESREVGVALTSANKQENRKSRSVGDLRDVMQSTITRRRSDEIRYWRQSYDQGVLSPLSSNKPDGDEEPLIVEEVAESDKENYEPPQPFNFGPIGEMAGMKITQAASLETRVMQLEDRMLKMERVILQRPYTAASTEAMQFQDSIQRQKAIGRPTTGDSDLSLPKNKLHRGSPQRLIRQGPGSQYRSTSYGSSRPSTQNNNISAQPSFENPPVAFSTFHPNAPRPLSTSTTIRNNNPNSSSPITKDGALTIEHYNTLTSLIQSEQTARQTLEDLVQNLQHEVHALRHSIAHHPAFSTFSRDGSDDEDEVERFVEDDFQTPMEQPAGARSFGDEIFGDVSGNRGVGYEKDLGYDGKTASRTLSLGHITQRAQAGAF